MAKICIDAGHYGKYNRGINPAYYESLMAWKLSKMLGEEIQKRGHAVIYTRENQGKDLALSARGKFAADNGADMLVSLHSNATDDASVRGIEVYYSVDQPGELELAQKLAAAANSVMQIPLRGNRGAKTWESIKYPGEDYQTVVDSAEDNGVPRIFLIEHGFHTNAQDCAILMDDAKLRAIAVAESDVICAEFGPVSYNENNGGNSNMKYYEWYKEKMELRDKPSTSGNDIGDIPMGTVLQAIEESGTWVKVNYNGTVGWVSKQPVFAREVPAPDPAAPQTVPKTDYDAVVAERDAYKARAEAAEGKLVQIHNISG